MIKRFNNYIRSTANFRTKTNGNWNSNIWEVQLNDSSWEACAYSPEKGNNVTIRTGHLVELTQNEECNYLDFEGTGFVYNGIYNVTLYGLNSSTSALLAEFDGLPDFQVQLKYDEIILGLKSDACLSGGTGSNWDNLDLLQLRAAHNRQAAYLNIKNPVATPMSDVVAPYFEPWAGTQGDGATMYCDLNWNPAVDGVNYTQNSAYVGVYSKTNEAGNYKSVGARNGSNQGTMMRMRTATDICQGLITAGTNLNIGAASSQLTSALYMAYRRVNSTQQRTNKNGVATGSELVSTSNSVTIPSLNWYSHCENLNGTATDFDGKVQSALVIGGGYIDSTTIKSRIDTYETAVLAYVNKKGQYMNFLMGSQGQSNDSGAGIGANFQSKYQAVIPNTKILYSGSMSDLQLGVNNKNTPNGNGGIDLVLAYQLQDLTGKKVRIAKEDWGGTQIYKDEYASTTSISIGTGSKAVTISTGFTGYSSGQYVIIKYDDNNYMTGTLSSYNSGTGLFTINSTTAVGSGTYTSWTAGLRDWSADSRTEFCDTYIEKLKTVIDYCVSNSEPFRIMDVIIHGEEDGLDTTKANAFYSNRLKFRKYVYTKLWDYIGTTYPTLTLPRIKTVVMETPSNSGANGDTVRAAEALLVSEYSADSFLMSRTGLSTGAGTLNGDGVHISASGSELVGERDSSSIIALW
jgi:hypothetical protein